MPVKLKSFRQLFYLSLAVIILYNLALLLVAGRTWHAIFSTAVFDVFFYIILKKPAWIVLQAAVQLMVFFLFVYLKFGTFFNKAVFL